MEPYDLVKFCGKEEDCVFAGPIADHGVEWFRKASCSTIPDTSKKTHGIFVVFPHTFWVYLLCRDSGMMMLMKMFFSAGGKIS